MEATKGTRRDNLTLFTNFNPNSLGQPASKRVLATWMAEVIRTAYASMGHTDPLSVRANPHSLRGVASTYAELASVSPKEICRAATWSKYCVFSTFYRLDKVAVANFGTGVLETASRAPAKL